MKVHQSSILVSIYLVFAILIFVTIALPSLEMGGRPLRISADMDNYIYITKNINNFSFFQIGGNILGPVLILLALNFNYVLIFILNCIIFILSYNVIVNNFDIKRNVFTLLFLISPILFISLFSLNKEILSLLATSVFISYLRNKNLRYLVFSILFSILVRYQLTFVFILTFFFIRNISFFIKKKYVIIILIVSISFLFPFARDYFLMFEKAPKSSYGGGTVLIWNNLQNKFLYFLAIIPKFLQTFFGGIKGILHLSLDDFYNRVIIPLQSLVFFMVIPLLYKKKFINDDITFFIVIYLIIFLLAPFIQLRYFFCLYPVLCILIAQRRQIKYE